MSDSPVIDDEGIPALPSPMAPPVFMPSPKILEIEVPDAPAIYYLEGAVRSGIETLERALRFAEYSHDDRSAEGQREALAWLLSLVNKFTDVQRATNREYQQFLANLDETRSAHSQFGAGFVVSDSTPGDADDPGEDEGGDDPLNEPYDEG